MLFKIHILIFYRSGVLVGWVVQGALQGVSEPCDLVTWKLSPMKQCYQACNCTQLQPSTHPHNGLTSVNGIEMTSDDMFTHVMLQHVNNNLHTLVSACLSNYFMMSTWIILSGN